MRIAALLIALVHSLTVLQVDDDNAASARMPQPQIGRSTIGEDVVFTNTRAAEQTADVTIKSEPIDDDDDDARDVAGPADGEAPRRRSTSVPDPEEDEGDEDLYRSSVSPQLVRGISIATDSFEMHGGLGDRDIRAGTDTQSPEPASDLHISPAYLESRQQSRTPAHNRHASMIEGEGQRRPSNKRKAPREVEEANHAVEEAELALLEVQARKRLLAARSARDSLML